MSMFRGKKGTPKVTTGKEWAYAEAAPQEQQPETAVSRCGIFCGLPPERLRLPQLLTLFCFPHCTVTC